MRKVENRGLYRVVSIGVLVLHAFNLNAFAQSEDVNEAIDVFTQESVFAPSKEALDGAIEEEIEGILKRYDPYAEYRSNSRLANRDDGSLYYYYGFELFESQNKFYILPYIDSPVAEAGVTDVTQLFSINDQPILGMAINEVLRLLDSSQEKVDLILINDEGKVKVSLVSRHIYLNPVEVFNDGDVTVIRIRKFSHGVTFEMLKNLLVESFDQSDSKKIILDLRYCQGGDLYSAFDSSSLFVPFRKTLAFLSGADNKPKRFRALPLERNFMENPIEIWTSARTASAAEIFVRSIMAYSKVEILGEQTAGKCVSQSEYTLKNGSKLLLSNYRILSPGRKYCNGIGVSPSRLINDIATLPIDQVTLLSLEE